MGLLPSIQPKERFGQQRNQICTYLYLSNDNFYLNRLKTCLDFYGLLNSTDLTYAQNENKKVHIKISFLLQQIPYVLHLFGEDCLLIRKLRRRKQF